MTRKLLAAPVLVAMPSGCASVHDAIPQPAQDAAEGVFISGMWCVAGEVTGVEWCLWPWRDKPTDGSEHDSDG